MIYRNDGSSVFTDIGAGLPIYSASRVAWGDYDSDGLMDFAISGTVAGVAKTAIYHNNGNGTFTDINAGLSGVAAGALAWGDYNNDGRPDLLFTDSTGSGYLIRVYRNNGDGTFSDSGISLPGITSGSAAWGDFDNDGRLDIALSGDTGGGYITRIYRNNGPDGTGAYRFTDIAAGLPGVYKSSVAWGDFDNDGRLDLALNGGITRIYRNNGNNTFSDINAGLTDSANCPVAWGDVDNDGRLDLAVADPTNNLSHPWNLGGTITYTGPQTGVIHVVACTNGTDWVWVYADTITNSMTYAITHLPPNAYYWVRAWRDSNNDNLPTSWEAWGSHNSNPVFLDANLTGQDISLDDPENDGDGVPDWWEVLYGLDPTRGGGDGLTAWWKLDEGTGTNAFDSTANANNGVLYGFATNAWVTGIISNSLHFDGTNTYVEVPDSVSLKSESISIGLWVKPDRLYTNGTATFVSKWVPGGTTGYGLGYDNGALAFTICKSGAKTLRYPCALTSNVPVHVVGAYSGGNQQIYVNGMPVAQTNYIFGMEIGGIENGTNSLKLGAASGGTLTNLFAGTLDDVRIGPGGWSSNDVAAIYQIGADPDHDGLSTAEEYKYGTIPTNSDTDGDGLTDGSEVYLFGTDPAYVVNATLPFGTGFEVTNGFTSGSLNNQQGWMAFPADGISVQSSMVHTGSQAVAGQGLSSLSTHGLASTAAVVTAEAWIFWNATQSTPPTNVPTGVTTMVSFDASQGIVAFNGNGQGGGAWVTATNTMLVGQWVNLKVEQNYTNRTWKVWVNGVEKLSGLGFKDSSPARLRAVNIQDGTAGPLFVDDLKVEAQQ